MILKGSDIYLLNFAEEAEEVKVRLVKKRKEDE